MGISCLVKKANSGYGLVINNRALNAVTIPQVLRILRLDEVLDCVGETKAQFFLVLDCTQGFHHYLCTQTLRKRLDLTHQPVSIDIKLCLRE